MEGVGTDDVSSPVCQLVPLYNKTKIHQLTKNNTGMTSEAPFVRHIELEFGMDKKQKNKTRKPLLQFSFCLPKRNLYIFIVSRKEKEGKEHPNHPESRSQCLHLASLAPAPLNRWTAFRSFPLGTTSDWCVATPYLHRCSYNYNIL